MSYSRVAALIFWFFCEAACKPKENIPPVYPEHLRRAVVLCFHDIIHSRPPAKGRKSLGRRYAIPLEDFRKILDSMAAFRVVSLKDWAHGQHAEDRRPRVVLTFDDGYIAHRELVLPELIRRGFGATFYFYADQLQRDKKWISLASDNAHDFDFGSHSWSHALLRDIGYDAMFRELYLARNFMEETLKRKIESFAWPYGYYSAEGLEAARAAGFAQQVSVDYRIASRQDIGKVIPRYTVFGRNAVTQVRQILDAFQTGSPMR